MSTINTSYVEIIPTDPRYRRLIQTALKTNDKLALYALKDKLGKPIHFVTQWFQYYLMQHGNPNPDAAVIHSPMIRPGLIKLGKLPDSDAVDLIPLEAYDFLFR